MNGARSRFRLAGPDGPTESPEARRRRLLIEIGVVLGVAVVPDLYWALMPADPDQSADSSGGTAWLIARSIAVCAPILYMIARSGQRWSDFGFVRWRWRLDTALTAGLIVAAMVVWRIGCGAWFGLDATLAAPHGRGDPALLETVGVRAAQVVSNLANGFAEELAIWGFLFTRLREVTGRAAVSVAACALVFASYHLYQGVGNAALILLFGLVHGAVFASTRRLWPLVIAHAMGNIWQDLQTPLIPA